MAMFSEGAGSFWGGSFGGASPIDDLLEKGGFTLEDVLDEDTCIQETKGNNARLLEFLKEPATLEVLIKYMACTDIDTFRELSKSSSAVQGDEAAGASRVGDTTPETSGVQGEQDAAAESAGASSESDEAAQAASLLVDDEGALDPVNEAEIEEERFMKFPFIACEILCCNITQLIEPLVNDSTLLNVFFGILGHAAPLDLRVSGYFYKVLAILLRRAPEKMLWFSVYRNVDISAAGESAGRSETDSSKVGWLMPMLLEHIDSYSIMCCFKTFLQVAAEDNGVVDDDDEDGDMPRYGQDLEIGDLDGRPEENDEVRNALLRKVRSIWLGGSGAALAVLDALAASNNSDSHNNAAELLADMIQRAAMSRLQTGWFQQVREHQRKQWLLQNQKESGGSSSEGADGSAEGKSPPPELALFNEDNSEGELPVFSGMILTSRGSGPIAESVMIESGCEWSLKLCEKLLRVALFESEPQQEQHEAAALASDEGTGEEFNRIVHRGSAAIASLQVLTHLVSAFGLERWAAPGEAAFSLNVSSSAASPETMPAGPITSMETHGELPPELDAILARLPDIVQCLENERHMVLFNVSKEHADKYLGIHRLKIVELLCMLIHTKYPKAIDAIASDPGTDPSKPNPLSVCLDLFFHFEWNNCLHAVLERTFQFIFLGGVSEESMGFDTGSSSDMEDEEEDEESQFYGDGGADGSGQAGGPENPMVSKRIRARQEEIAREQETANNALLPLHKALFYSCGLIDRLLWAYGDNQSCMKSTEEFWAASEAGIKAEPSARSCGQRGYMGFCHRIVNTIALLAAAQRNEREQHDTPGKEWPALESTNKDEWVDLLQGEIANINAIEQSVLGGSRPRSYSSPGSDGMGADLGGDMDDFESEERGLEIDHDIGFKNYIASYTQGMQDDNSDSEDDEEFDMMAAESAAEDEDLEFTSSSDEKPDDAQLADQMAGMSLNDTKAANVEKAEETGGNNDNEDDFDPFGDGSLPAETDDQASKQHSAQPPAPPPAAKDESWEPDFGD